MVTEGSRPVTAVLAQLVGQGWKGSSPFAILKKAANSVALPHLLRPGQGWQPLLPAE